MSFTSLLGFFFGFGLFILSIAIATDNYHIFWEPTGIIMVFGGTFASTFISYELRYAMSAFKSIGHILRTPKIGRYLLNFEVGRMIRWGYVIQSKGLAGLEQEMKKARQDDPFISFAMELLVTGYPGDNVRTILENTVETTYQRQMIQVKILKYLGGAAPAFGMIGTLVGLMVMLSSMGSNPDGLGLGMAVALNTTLYGLVLARLIFIPAANKVEQRHQIMRFRNHLMVEGFAMLADKKSPRYIQDSMNSYLDPSIHYNIDKQLRKGADKAT